jgi:hypothetical protein
MGVLLIPLITIRQPHGNKMRFIASRAEAFDAQLRKPTGTLALFILASVPLSCTRKMVEVMLDTR